MVIVVGVSEVYAYTYKGTYLESPKLVLCQGHPATISIELHGLLSDRDLKLVAVLLEHHQFLGSEHVAVRLREHLEVVRLVVASVVDAPVLPDDAYIHVGT